MKYSALRAWGMALLALTCGVAGSVGTLAAQATAAAPPAQTTIVKTVRNVTLVFPVLDKKNHFVAGLNASQIEVLDNNQPQNIQHFNAEGNLPLRIVLLLDISNSIRARWDFEQRAALDFLHSILVEGRDQAMVVGFDSTLHITTPFTDNFDKLVQGVRQLNPSGGTALYDALFTTAHDYLGTANTGETRNVIIIITDGNDDQSRYSRDEALEMAENVGAVIYAIGTEPTGSDPTSDKVLELYAQQTGGLSFFPIESRDLGGAFQTIVNDLRHQYVLSYNPNNFVANGQYHQIQVKVNVKGATARPRKGYYAIAPAAPKTPPASGGVPRP